MLVVDPPLVPIGVLGTDANLRVPSGSFPKTFVLKSTRNESLVIEIGSATHPSIADGSRCVPTHTRAVLAHTCRLQPGRVLQGVPVPEGRRLRVVAFRNRSCFAREGSVGAQWWSQQRHVVLLEDRGNDGSVWCPVPSGGSQLFVESVPPPGVYTTMISAGASVRFTNAWEPWTAGRQSRPHPARRSPRRSWTLKRPAQDVDRLLCLWCTCRGGPPFGATSTVK